MTTEPLAESIAQAVRAYQPIPGIQAEFDLNQAYELQHAVTALRSPQGGAGVKVGVTNAGAQAYFGLDHALLGSLYADGRYRSGDELPFVAGGNMETEFAVIVDRQGLPKWIAPAIEFVFVHFERDADMTAANLVISNLGADRFLVGDFLPWDSPHVDAAATLRKNGEVVCEASMNDALGGPAEALPWVWDEIRLRGYPLADETLIMMGACGPVTPAEPGAYHVDYGPMGSVAFTVN